MAVLWAVLGCYGVYHITFSILLFWSRFIKSSPKLAKFLVQGKRWERDLVLALFWPVAPFLFALIYIGALAFLETKQSLNMLVKRFRTKEEAPKSPLS